MKVYKTHPPVKATIFVDNGNGEEWKTDVTGIYEIMMPIMEQCLEKTFETFLKNHIDKKVRRGWTLR